MEMKDFEEEVVESEEKAKKLLSKIGYFGLCVLCLLVGVVLLIAAYKAATGKASEILESLGWNFVASAFISFLFSLKIDLDHKHKNNLMMKKIHKIVRYELSGIDSVLPRYANDTQLENIVRKLLLHSQNHGELNIDVMGVSLSRFYKEQLEFFAEQFKKDKDDKVLGNPNCRIRLIMQKPDKQMLDIISLAEGKNSEIMESKIVDTIDKVQQLKKLLSKKKKHAQIELKLNDDCPAQTITRINDVIFPQVRPVKKMAAKEGSKPFFNCYDSDREKEQFDYMLGYFEAVWDDSETAEVDDND